MTVNTWIVVAEDPGIRNLVEAAKQVGGPINALVVAPREVADAVAVSGVDAVRWIERDDEVPIEAYAATVKKALGNADAC